MVSVRLKELNSTIQIPSRKLELVRPLEKPFYYSAMYGKVPTSANFRGNLTPEERSMFSMDSSYLFEILFKRHYKNNAGLLLGEIQYAYISSVVGGCVTGLHQWKQLLTLLCNCEKSLERRIELFSELNRILVLQIRFAPKDYLGLASFLFPIMENYLEILNDVNMETFQVQKRDLEKILKRKFGWEYSN
uniref:AAR2 C-terminal domain-containing protein n=1 Tax=Amorphochlora amoebiformis TaxID=1561963 RepID=A0A6T6VUI1_9EUKA|mmetsp:Transcript_25692/g.40625  ORF Transcript_25692/g.40625 Transcript_25692/m.40625 type:complete len:190 (+) Transcript_25692:404-973(+)